MIKKLHKNPLRPLVIIGFGRADFSTPIKRKTNIIQLLAVTFDIIFSCNSRMCTCLNRILFSRQTKRIVAHRIQNIEAFEPLETGINIRRNVSQRMPDVQARTRRIREHIQNIELGFRATVRHFIRLVLCPKLFPLRFDSTWIVFHNYFIFLFQRKFLCYYLLKMRAKLDFLR